MDSIFLNEFESVWLIFLRQWYLATMLCVGLRCSSVLNVRALSNRRWQWWWTGTDFFDRSGNAFQQSISSLTFDRKTRPYRTVNLPFYEFIRYSRNFFFCQKKCEMNRSFCRSDLRWRFQMTYQEKQMHAEILARHLESVHMLWSDDYSWTRDWIICQMNNWSNPIVTRHECLNRLFIKWSYVRTLLVEVHVD